jgi:hypothetical protein
VLLAVRYLNTLKYILFNDDLHLTPVKEPEQTVILEYSEQCFSRISVFRISDFYNSELLL